MSFSKEELNVRFSILKDEKIKKEVKIITLIDLLGEKEIKTNEAKEYLINWNVIPADLFQIEEELNRALNNKYSLQRTRAIVGRELIFPKEQINLLGTEKDTFIVDRTSSIIEVKFSSVSNISKQTLNNLKKNIGSQELGVLILKNQPCKVVFDLSNGDYYYDEFLKIAISYEWDSIVVKNMDTLFTLKRGRDAE